MQYEDTTKQIIGAAYDTYNLLGAGYVEKDYSIIFARELEKRGLHFQKEVACLLLYDTGLTAKSKRADYVIEDKVVVELKQLPDISKSHVLQTVSYLKLLKLEVGLVINFSYKRVQIKRVINSL